MIGDAIAHYQITAKLGEGGMGAVYRARDTKLQRDVALKLLPDHFADDHERLARFQREAQVLASLNHPNIAQIYGLEETGNTRCIVMEFVQGETLQERLKRGAIPIDEALPIAKQIAEALQAAHERGIVHRDLKPANINLTADGKVKVLDFGLAKALQQQKATTLSNSPTLMSASVPGTILGTAAYMSPEQARGKEADRSSDIWAFGCVIYEMLTGHAAFEGETIGEILGGVFKAEPDWRRLPVETPEPIRRLLRRCLQKDRNRRLNSANDARLEIDEEQVPRRAPLGKVAWLASGVFFLATAILSFLQFRQTPPEARLLRAAILPPEGTTFDFINRNLPAALPALSPDGKKIVFGARTADGRNPLWVRPLEAPTAQPLAGTDGATFPFWSPDSRFIAFFADGKLKKIDASRPGPALTLADAPNARGGAWSREGVIVFAPRNNGPLQRVSAAGEAAVAATVMDVAEGAVSHRWPWFLPDGKHFVYASLRQGTNGMVLQVGALDSRERELIGQADSDAVYSSGYLLFLRENALMAQPFDTRRLAVIAEAVPVAEQVQHQFLTGRKGVFSVSDEGLLIFQTGAGPGGSQRLTWFDRSGKPESTLGNAGDFSVINFSPDRKSLAASVIDSMTANVDIWTYDVSRGLPARFTFGGAVTALAGNSNSAIWSPDGRSIVFSSNRKGHADLYRKTADGSRAEELLYADNVDKQPTSWSPDGKFLLFSSFDPNTAGDLWVFPMTSGQSGGAPKPFPFLRTNFSEGSGQFSPDGRWVAYQSNESRRDEVYAVPFPGPGGKRQISTSGGFSPRWRHDGKEIFYIAPDLQLMAATVNIQGGTLEVKAVRPLFGPMFTTGYHYDIALDGQHILAASASEQKVGQPLTLVQNWTAGLKK
jgi:Tol biopolymer transport system component/tRNA A-37 threonylcarbamoyl transferase component Bud32